MSDKALVYEVAFRNGHVFLTTDREQRALGGFVGVRKSGTTPWWQQLERVRQRDGREVKVDPQPYGIDYIITHR